ncbi:MAG: tryptophan-rich sensory protein [Pseudomonadota bacterium]|nr:tryptophan-rich sensory protein [Pseudomonadota bacterium]
MPVGSAHSVFIRTGRHHPPFGPVWTALSVLTGIAAWLTWRHGGFRAAKSALTLFLVQHGLNSMWSWL